MRISVLFFVVVMAGSAFAQQPASMAFVLSEQGMYATSLAALTVGSSGAVTGVQVIQQASASVTYAVQGIFATNIDGSKSLTLRGTSTDSVDMNGEPLVSSVSLKLIALPSGGYAGFRDNPGQYAYAQLLVAASGLAPGNYVVNGRTIDPAAMSIDLIGLNTAGNVIGKRVKNSFGEITEVPLTGSCAPASGFYTIQLKAISTDADGNQTITPETYLALPTLTDVLMIRTDRASGLLTLAQ